MTKNSKLPFVLQRISPLSLALVFLINSPAQGELSASAGQTLLESFRCESTNGSTVQGVRNSLTSLKSTLEKIAEQQKECQADLAAVGRLPEIDSILRQIENHGATEDIRRQELIIVEAMNDLAMVQRIPAGSADRALYPDELTLQGMIANARVELLRMRVDGRLEAGKRDRQKYADGVRQLDSLAQELSASLRKNSQCFQKNPMLRRQVMSGLVGIAGFFAATPAGIGITLAGRILQNVFNISDSGSTNDNQNFESSQQTLLSAGLSCTMETLASQHCRLTRQEALLQQLNEEPCKDRECSPDLKRLQKIMASGKSATDAVAEVTSWLGGNTDNSSDQAIAMKINSDFVSATSEFESAIGAALEKAKQGESSSLSDVQKQNQLAAVQYAIYGYVNKIYSSSSIGTFFTPTEKRRGALNFIFDDKELEAILAEGTSEISSSPRLRQKYGVEGVAGTAGAKTADEASLSVLKGGESGTIGIENTDFVVAAKIRERMMSRIVFDRIKARVAQFKSTILPKTTVQPKDEQLGKFAMAFLQEDLGKPSTLKNFMSIQAFFENIPADFLASRDPVLNITAAKKEIDEIVQLGAALDEGTTPMSKEKVSELLVKVGRALDPGRGFKEKLASIASAVGSFQTKKLAKTSRSPQEMSDLMLIQNRDFLETVYDLKNPYQKEMDTKTAIALSGSQIDSFGKFFENYLEPALLMLNKKDIRGTQFSDGLSQNIDRSLKDHFCVQTLGLTNIPEKAKKECQGAVLKMGTSELKFVDFEKAPHKERVCAYRNFINRIDVNNSKREPTKSLKTTQ